MMGIDGMEKVFVVAGACADRRENKDLDALKKQYSEQGISVLFVRNAGIDVNRLKGTLTYAVENNSVKEVILLPHENHCAAMGALPEKHNELNRDLAKQFTSLNVDIHDLSAVEKKNQEVQESNAKAMLSKYDVKVWSRLIYTPDAEHSGHPLSLIVTDASEKSPGEITKALKENESNCYFLQAKVSEIIPDLRFIAGEVKGIANVRYVALKEEPAEQMRKDADAIKGALRGAGKENIAFSSFKLFEDEAVPLGF